MQHAIYLPYDQQQPHDIKTKTYKLINWNKKNGRAKKFHKAARILNWVKPERWLSVFGVNNALMGNLAK